jgi:hypothetical protein
MDLSASQAALTIEPEASAAIDVQDTSASSQTSSKKKRIAIGVAVGVALGVIATAIVVPLVMRSTSSSTTSPGTGSQTYGNITNTRIVVEPYVWGSIEGYTYPEDDLVLLRRVTVASAIRCRELCDDGCELAVFDSQTGTCSILSAEKPDDTGFFIKGQRNNVYTYGTWREAPTLSTITVPNESTCFERCKANPQCQLAAFDNRDKGAVQCMLKTFLVKAGVTILYRTNPREWNYNPAELGRFDFMGSSGIVAIHASLLHTGKILFAARPEALRGTPNYEAVVRPSVPYGELSTLFDPITGTFEVTPIDDNLFCHGAILLANGELFVAGGDDREELYATGLRIGIQNNRIFNPLTKQWRYVSQNVLPRFYPSVARLPDGRVFIIAGTYDGTKNNPIGQHTLSYEIYTNEATPNTYQPSQVIADGGYPYYPGARVVPGSGYLWIMDGTRWAIVNPATHQEVERETVLAPPIGYSMGSSVILLALDPDNNYEADALVVGGRDNFVDQIGSAKIHLLRLTGNGPKVWREDSDLLPYVRIGANLVLQPNGKVLIFNGAQHGVLGGGYIFITTRGSACHAMLYDPYAPAGNRTKLLALSPHQRLYHSVALLLPDGRSLIGGTGMISFCSNNLILLFRHSIVRLSYYVSA